MTHCNKNQFEFQAQNGRNIVGEFNGGNITSDAGGLLLRKLEDKRKILERFSECFTDYRNSRYIEHSVKELTSQRVFGIALGYEDLNDHDRLRVDPLLATLCEKKDLTGEYRRKRDQGKSLAGKSTLNRLELTREDSSSNQRYKKIVYHHDKIESLFVDIFIDSFKKAPKKIILDLDATDDRIHGQQEGRFYHGYYGSYCYLPLYVFCGEFLLCAKLRTADRDGSDGSVEEMQRVISQIRESWPDVQIVLRGDGGFARESLMSWCEDNGVDYLFGLARNKRLEKILKDALEEAKKMFDETHEPQRIFKDFKYKTLNSWNRSRRVVGKAEYLSKGSNPRYVVTSLSIDDISGADLYEQEYCARGDMENRIKEQQLYLFADRTSSQTMRANQLRLWFSSIAYVLMQQFRHFALSATDFAKAQCHTIREKLLKIGAQVRLSVRRIFVSLASNYPYVHAFQKAYDQISLL